MQTVDELTSVPGSVSGYSGRQLTSLDPMISSDAGEELINTQSVGVADVTSINLRTSDNR